MSATFGLFQAIMPALGYAGGALFRDAIAAYDHWVAFALLAAVGAHMIRESMGRDADEAPKGSPFAAKRLLILGVARHAELLGGVILILIGAKILAEHLSGAA